jgi:mycofactocin precursor
VVGRRWPGRRPAGGTADVRRTLPRLVVEQPGDQNGRRLVGAVHAGTDTRWVAGRAPLAPPHPANLPLSRTFGTESPRRVTVLRPRSGRRRADPRLPVALRLTSVAAMPETTPTDTAEDPAPAAEEALVEEALVEEALVEEVSIDGMCGVY